MGVGGWKRHPAAPGHVRTRLHAPEKLPGLLGRVDTGGMATTAAPAGIRQRARDNGIAVGDRGRLGPDVVAAYQEASAHAAAVPATAKRVSTSSSSGGQSRIKVLPAPSATGIAHRVRACSS